MLPLSRLGHSDRRKRGRPPLIEHAALISRCSNLLGFFEYEWAHVAWDLAHARSIPAIREALRKSGRCSQTELEPFVYEPTRVGNSEQLIAVRQHAKNVEALTRTALGSQREADEQLQTALMAEKSDPTDQKIKKLCARRQQQYTTASRQVAALQEELDRVREELRQREAHFAQSQLLDFIGSHRYTLTPLSYAKAMAGLPKITWRQSSAVCVKETIGHPYEAEYEKFSMVLKAFGSPPADAAVAIGRIRRFLLNKPASGYVISTLRKEWYYLQVAIEEAYAAKSPRSAIPYRVYAEYQRRTSSRSAYDQLMEHELAL